MAFIDGILMHGGRRMIGPSSVIFYIKKRLFISFYITESDARRGAGARLSSFTPRTVSDTPTVAGNATAASSVGAPMRSAHRWC